MTPTLFIRLRSAAAEQQVDACLAQDGRIARVASTDLAALAREAAGARVVAFIPASDTLSLAVALPPMPAAKARAALPFALEDQLAGELEDQHFALGARQADGRWPVRVISRARLAGWIDLLRRAGLEPQAVVADADGLREKPGDLMLWLDGEDAHWRAPGQPASTLPVDLLTEGPALAAGATPPGTLGIRAHGTPDDLARHAAAIDGLGRGALQVAAQALPDGALPWLAAQHDPSQVINLLQGDFAPARANSSGLDAWRWPLRLAAAALVLQLSGWGLEAWRLHRAAAPVEAALIEAARPLDPSVRDADAARALIAARLAEWDRRERDPSGSPLMQAAATLIDARIAAPALSLLSLRQQEDGNVTARFEADDPAASQAAREVLTSNGWTSDGTAAAAAGATQFVMARSAKP